MFDKLTICELTKEAIGLYENHRTALSLPPASSPKVRGCVCAFLLYSERYDTFNRENMIKCFKNDTKKYIDDVCKKTSFTSAQVAGINENIDSVIQNKDYNSKYGFLLATLTSCFLKNITNISASDNEREEYLRQFRTSNPEYDNILLGVRMLISS